MGGASSMPGKDSTAVVQNALAADLAPQVSAEHPTVQNGCQLIPAENLPPPVVRRPVPVNPDLSHWVSVIDWPSSEHWFKPGDLVEFYRKGCLYNHWGIYMGNGLVAHVTARDLAGASAVGLAATEMIPSVMATPVGSAVFTVGSLCVRLGSQMIPQSPPISMAPTNQYFVRMDPILSVAGRDQFRVSNLVHRAGGYVKRSFEETFDLVKQSVNRSFSYSAVKSNCEHFATYLRYKPKNQQVMEDKPSNVQLVPDNEEVPPSS